MNLLSKIKQFPTRPGIYLFKDGAGKVLYVGKAKSLRTRVSSYFKNKKEQTSKVKFLVKKAKEIDFIVTDTEKEALLLENTLIKKHRPCYNIQLKDDKTYVSIRVGLDHRFPGINITRRTPKDGAKYFGPYSSSTGARATVDQVIKTFKIRSCCDHEFANRVRHCLEFDLGRCSAPCVQKITQKNYLECVEECLLFLKGANQELLQRLKKRMQQASADMKYEEAAQLRNVFFQIKETLAKQNVVKHEGGDQDYLGLAFVENKAAICLLMMRGGVLLDRRSNVINEIGEDPEKIITSFLLTNYESAADIPKCIYLSHKVENKNEHEAILFDKSGHNVSIKVPQRGPSKQLVDLACKNAGETLKLRLQESKSIEHVLNMLQKKLKLKTEPGRIECLDITNLQGKQAYGSLVSFHRGAPDKNNYRLYSIQTLKTPDDYQMMHEVLWRRYSKFKQTTLPLPDLLLIDGGKGQLGVAKAVLDELGLKDLSVAAIAKGKQGEEDKIFLPGRKNPVKFTKNSPALLLLKKIRDEAHRFGITAHRKKRIKDTINQASND
ncbi:MAG: excinuclease ABC subunit UvrC [Pseudomonadota bacterium]